MRANGILQGDQMPHPQSISDFLVVSFSSRSVAVLSALDDPKNSSFLDITTAKVIKIIVNMFSGVILKCLSEILNHLAYSLIHREQEFHNGSSLEARI